MVRRSKYGNVRTMVNGQTFHSKREAEYFRSLLVARYASERSQRVVEIECQPRFPIIVNGQKCGAYIADFRVRYADGHVEVVDVKSAITAKIPLYRLKKKLISATLGIDILEV